MFQIKEEENEANKIEEVKTFIREFENGQQYGCQSESSQLTRIELKNGQLNLALPTTNW